MPRRVVLPLCLRLGARADPSEFDGGGTCFSWPVEVARWDGPRWREGGEWCDEPEGGGGGGGAACVDGDAGGGVGRRRSATPLGEQTYWAVRGGLGDC
eukprot:1979405-Prymnesium_polylepis.1